MSIVAAELKLYDSASHPEDDASASGGAINTAGKVELADPAAADRVSIQSDGADTRTVTITYRDTGGAIQSEALVANGTNWVDSTATMERILKIVTTSSGTRVITVARYASGSHTPVLATIDLNITTIKRNFYDAVSSGSLSERYEKCFFKNTNATLTLNAAIVKLTADPAAKLKIALALTKDDSGATPDGNRIGADSKPSGLTWVDDNVTATVPGSTLAAGVAIGVWLEQTLAINDSAFKNSYTLQLSGTTT